MDNSTQNIQKGRALAGFGKVFSGIGVVILVAGVILSATPAIAAGVIIAVIGGVMGASGGKKLQGAAQGRLAQDALRAVFQEAEYLPRQHISQETLQASGLPLPQAERMSGSGLVRARYHGRPLEISNLELLDLQPYQDPATQNWENNEVSVFRGRWMAAQLGHTLPCDLQAAKSNDGTLWKMSGGRLATVENARRAAEMGVDLIVLTGNPGNGVSNELIVEALKAISAAVGDRVLLAAGKMHASGVAGEGGEKIMTPADAEAFMAAGADIILLPAPGTVPGITQEYAHRLIEVVHSRGKLALTAIGTSQEGADVATIRQIALMCKMAGADIHHIGDTGVPGMALPQNIMAYSIAIRGERHTYHKMAQSVNR